MSIKNTAIPVLFSVVAVFMTAAGNDESGQADADAGSLGLTAVATNPDAWCLADAGSAGFTSPIKVCGG